MKIRENYRLMKLFAGFLPVLIFASCVRDFGETPAPDNDEDAMVTFSIQVPGASKPASRSLSQIQENEVTQIDVLLFEKDGGTYKEKAICGSSSIETDGSNSRLKTFTIRLRRGEWDLVVLANARDIVSAASLAGKTKETALAELKIAMPAGDKWIATGTTTGYRPFPMWGNVGNITINDQTDLTGSNRVRMTRMVARVDVLVTGTAADNFVLKSVDVYNYNTQGSLVPKMADWDTSDPTMPKATAPNVPSTSTITYDTRITYDGMEINAGNCTNEIYIFESENHKPGGHTEKKDLDKRTCLVVGGIYGANEEMTYYRVDFAEGSGVTQYNYLDVLRNHRYIFSIEKVSGSGYDDSYTAYISGPVNIEAEVLQWNEHEFTEIVFDSQWALGVNKGLFEFTHEKREETPDSDNILAIKTDYPDGWTATVWGDLGGTTPAPWLTLSAYSGAVGIEEISLLMPANTTTADLIAYVHIKAGRLVYKVKVIHQYDPSTAPTLSGIYVGRFGGELKMNALGEWEFEKDLYMEESDDSVNEVWQTNDVLLPGGTTTFEGGKYSTYNLYLASTTHPAANTCFLKNSVVTGLNDPNYIWYLPAQKQLQAIWVAHNGFDPADKLIDSNYWSSTEGSANSAWAAYLGDVWGDGGTNASSKDNWYGMLTFRIRCVREVAP